VSTTVVVRDLDGTLTAAEIWRGVLAWVRATHPSAAARRFVTVRLPLVAVAKLGLYDKEAFRARWLGEEAGLLRGLPTAELDAMGEWAVEHHLWPARRTAVIDMVEAAVEAARAIDPGARLIVASGGYQPVADAFARRLGAVGAGTPLELRDGAATGRLDGPTRSGRLKAQAVAHLAGGGEILAAFGDTAADIPLLELARRAVAVAPDAALRREAQRRGWEVLEAG
jgi:HAD superfamily phosphoserine phosphatase-like hydrolase